MIKQTTTAVIFTAIVAAISISHSAIASSDSDEFFGNVLGEIIVNAISDSIYNSQREKEEAAQRRYYRAQSSKKKRRSISPLVAEGIRLQKALRSMGHYDTPLDGKLDSYKSRTAIMQYQKRYGLSQSGVLTSDVEEVLLQQGDLAELSKYLGYAGDTQDDKAKQLQAALMVQGYYVSTIDGDFGPKSMTAMRLYQEASGMIPSGALLSEEDEKLVADSVQLLKNEQAQLEQALVQMAATTPLQQEVTSTQTEQVRQSSLLDQPLTPLRPTDDSHSNPATATEIRNMGVSVISEATVLKADADSSSETLEWLSAGVEIKVNSTAGDWAQVTIDGQQGYVFAEFLEGYSAAISREDDQLNENKVAEKLLQILESNGEITKECIRETEKVSDLISIRPVSLRTTGEDLLVTGNHCACTGARVCIQWIFQKNDESYRLLFATLADAIEPLNTVTHGYKDIRVTALHSASATIAWVGNYKFDGSEYEITNK